MNISKQGLALIESFEGYSYHAYWDQWGRVWTVGYGETENVGPGTTMTRQQAEADLLRRLEREYEPAINALGVPLNQNQYDALCSFVWNLGPGSMRWDVGRYVQAREYGNAAAAMLEYVRAGGVVLPGLVRRRQAERALFLTPCAPPAPVDPYHYRVLTRQERRLVSAYDGARRQPVKYAGYLVRLRLELATLAHDIWVAAHKPGGGGWNVRHRGERFQVIWPRTKGRQVAR